MSRDLKIFTENIDPAAMNQIYEIIKTPPFEGARIRIMPDVHSGKGCVVGFTSTVGDKIIPNIIGVDIGCGMLTVPLGKHCPEFSRLDDFIRKNIPAGNSVHKNYTEDNILRQLKCFDKLHNTDKLYRSAGTLGGGNHFIEIDKDDEGCYYLVIHTGSRNAGHQVACIYQSLAVEMCKSAAEEKKAEAHESLMKSGMPHEIPDALKEISDEFAHLTKIPSQLCFLTGAEMENYLHDVRVCQEFARLNRQIIADKITDFMGVLAGESFDTVHNYIDDSFIVRKGAISAHKGERVLIPMNMRDGCLIAVGKGNADWNFSAPHGAGRLYRRSAVKELFSVDDFRREMLGIYTSCVSQGTLDEAPMAYKPADEIMSLISPTVEIERVIKPVYNFKAGR